MPRTMADVILARTPTTCAGTTEYILQQTAKPLAYAGATDDNFSHIKWTQIWRIQEGTYA